VGAPEESWGKIAPLTHSPLWWSWWQTLLPRMLGGGRVPATSIVSRLAVLGGVPLLSFGQHMKSKGGTNQKTIETTSCDSAKLSCGAAMMAGPNSATWRKAEIPSANVHASARALAKVAATIVGGGQLQGGARLLSEDGVAEAHAGEVQMNMFNGMLDSHFGNAGWNDFKDGRMGYVGWMGLGGSVMQWQPKNRIGFGYAMNLLELSPSNERARALQGAVAVCAEKTFGIRGERPRGGGWMR